MIIKINMQSEVPIYLQLRNEIVKGIGRGEFEPGESLPTVRQMATDLEQPSVIPLPLLHKITALTKSWQMNWNF